MMELKKTGSKEVFPLTFYVICTTETEIWLLLHVRCYGYDLSYLLGQLSGLLITSLTI